MGIYSKLNRPIAVISYDPRWSQLYEEEKHRIAVAFGDKSAQFEHFGSTAIPGLAAKPVIDIAIGIERLDDADVYLSILQGLGYTYVPELEADIPARRFLWRVTPAGQRYHINLTEVHAPEWEQPLLFRDYLRDHPAEAAEYERLKERLAAECGSDISAYIQGKTGFVKHILGKAHRGRVDTIVQRQGDGAAVSRLSGPALSGV
jgi:GrpB-like predicted nucleotidyltransferase (UPF0157 family)